MRLGLLFLIIDAMPHQALWHRWLDSRHARAWVHAKHPERVACPWVRRRLLRTAWAPEWGSIELVHAMMALLRAALEVPSITHVQFLSESCIPVRTLVETVRHLEPHTSWLDAVDRPNNGYSALRQFSRVQRPGRIFKSDQWSLLSRAHAQRVLDVYRQDPELAEFRHVQAADEIFVPTALLQAPPGSAPRVRPAKSVYVDWSISCKHPRTFSHAEGPAAMARARALGALFLRKVADTLDHNQWDAWRAGSTKNAPARAPADGPRLDALAARYPHDSITPYFERIWPETECWAYVHAASSPCRIPERPPGLH